MIPMCGPLAAELLAAWVVDHFVIGFACLVLAALVWRAPRGIVRNDYRAVFAAFLFACAVHHIARPLYVWPALQTVIDTAMALISVIMSGYLAYDVGRDLLHLRGR